MFGKVNQIIYPVCLHPHTNKIKIAFQCHHAQSSEIDNKCYKVNDFRTIQIRLSKVKYLWSISFGPQIRMLFSRISCGLTLSRKTYIEKVRQRILRNTFSDDQFTTSLHVSKTNVSAKCCLTSKALRSDSPCKLQFMVSDCVSSYLCVSSEAL